MVLSYFLLPLPMDLSPGSYVLRAGMYIYPDIVTVPVINTEGQAIDDGAELTHFVFSK